MSQYQQHLLNISQQNQQSNNNCNNQNSSQTQSNTIMPKNEPVKVVYPSSGTQQSTSAAVLSMNNRVTFTSAPLQNGTITLSQLTSQHQQNQQIQQQSQQNNSGGLMQANIKITGTNVQQGGQPHQQLIIKNTSSSAPGTIITSSPGIMTMSKTVNNQVTTSFFNIILFQFSLFFVYLFDFILICFIVFSPLHSVSLHFTFENSFIGDH